MNHRLLYVIPFLFQTSACIKQKQQQNNFGFKPPTVVEAKAYKVPKEKTKPPAVIPLRGEKKVPAGKPEIVAIEPNVFLANAENKIIAGKPEIIIPGTGKFESPEVITAIDSSFNADLPEIILIKDFYTKESNPESFSSIKAMQGLNSEEISSLCQDKAGNLWIGTWYGGVSKYDGRSLTNYYTEQGLNSDLVSCVLEDKSGNIWIGTADAGVNKFDGKNITHYSTTEGLSNNEILTMLQDKNGNIWFATKGGLNRYDGHSFTHYTTNQGLPNDTIQSLLEDSKGNLWFGFNGGLARFDGTSFHNYSMIANLKDTTEVTSILEDSKGDLWFGTNNGLFKYDGKYISHFTTKGGLSSNSIAKIIEDNRGEIWIATWDKGVNRFNGNSFTHLGLKQGLISETVTSLLRDKHDNIWIATDAGVCKYEGKLFRHVVPDQGLSKKNLTCVTADKHGNIWIGTWGGGINKYDGKSIARYTTAQGLINDAFSAILEDKPGDIWFGTSDPVKSPNGGVAKYDGKSFTHYYTANGLIDPNVYCVFEDKKGDLWFGTPKGLSKFDGKYFTNYLTEQGLCSNAIASILEDHNGILWIGTYDKGVCSFDGVSFTHYDMAHSLSNPMVLGMMEDKNNNLWFCTSKGVNKYDGKNFTWYTTEQGLSNNIAKNVLEDKNGNIWVGTLNGMNRFIPHATDSGFSFFKKYTVSEGFSGGGTYENSITQDSNRNIWIGANDRLTRYYPEADVPDTIPPTIQLSSIALFDENINWLDAEKKKDNVVVLNNGTKLKHFDFSDLTPWHNQPQNLELTYNNNYISFQFVGITTNRPKEVRYRYFLEGLDDNWSAMTSQPEATYSNLPPRKYTFKVKAVNSEGYWSKELNYTFIIHPPWWKTWWFRAAAIMCIVALVYAIMRWRIQQKFRLKLERSQNEKQLAELRHQKTDLEIQALRAQMNPHFIFNSLNSINNFILQNNRTQASEYLTKFSRLVRLILQNSQASLITLESELESLKLYLELEMLRFDDHFAFKIIVADELDAEIIKIPPLIIQPFAENAIWHGLMHKEEKGHLQIELFQQDEMLCCKIMDDGIGRKKAGDLNHNSATMHKSMGLRITEERIAMLQAQQQIKSSVQITDLILSDGTAAGTEVLLKIPLII